MGLIKNINIYENNLKFDLDNKSNEFKISLCNGIRRVILSEIETYCLDENKIDFVENNSILNNEFLKHRLILIPFICNKNIDYEDLVIKCKVSNELENIKSVYVSDFELYNEKTDSKLDIKDFVIYPDLLFAKLKNNQYFSFEAKFSKGKSRENGAQHCPVSSCTVTFKQDDNQIKEMTKEMDEEQKKSFMLLENQRIIKKNKEGMPDTYQFQIESIGFYDSKTLIKKAIDILKNKLNECSKLFEEIEINKEFYQILLTDCNDTIGNLISSYVQDIKEVTYSGYLIEHPLKEHVIFKFKSTLSKKDLINKINLKLKEVNGLLEKINKEI